MISKKTTLIIKFLRNFFYEIFKNSINRYIFVVIPLHLPPPKFWGGRCRGFTTYEV